MYRNFALQQCLVEDPDGTAAITSLHIAAYFVLRGHRIAGVRNDETGKTAFVFSVDESFWKDVLNFDMDISVPIKAYLSAIRKAKSRAFGTRERRRHDQAVPA